MDNISTDQLFSANGARADITLEEWLNGWVSIVGGVGGRPTAQQFNTLAYILQTMILANQKAIETASKTATDAVPAKSFTKDTIVNKIADGKLIENLNAGMLGGHNADYFAPATAGFCRYTDNVQNGNHYFTGEGNSHGYVFISTAYTSWQGLYVNGTKVSVYAGGDAVEEIAAGHWYVFTYDQSRKMIDFVAMGTSKYLKKSGGRMSGRLEFGSSTNYVDQSGNAHFNSVIATNDITGRKVYQAVYNDYAEFFPRGESTEPGDIIALDAHSSREQYVKAVAGDRIVGVHSDDFAHLIGGDPAVDGEDFFSANLPKYIPVGLCGRCRVKALGAVHRGDYIVPSTSYPGVGIAVQSVAVPPDAIGFAVEDSDNPGIHRVRVKLRG